MKIRTTLEENGLDAEQFLSEYGPPEPKMRPTNGMGGEFSGGDFLSQILESADGSADASVSLTDLSLLDYLA